MRNKVTAMEFFDSWCRVTKTQKDELLKVDTWYGTTVKTALAEELLKLIAEELHYKCHYEYYHTDAVYFLEEDKVPGTPEYSTWLRDMRVAIEHENIFSGNLYQELSHLMLLNCELRVLISYPHDYEKNKILVLKTLFTIISETVRASEFSDEESILIILGTRNDDENLAKIYWEGYTYNKEQWKLIAPIEELGALITDSTI